MKTLNSEQVFAALFELFKRRPELVEQTLPAKPDPGAEPAAISLLLAVCRGAPDAWQLAPDDARQVATMLLIDFMAKLMLPNGEFSERRWTVRSPSKWKQALEVIEQEIASIHPAQGRPH